MQKATYLKSYKTLDTFKNSQGNSLAALDNEYILHVADSVHISLGADIQLIANNIDVMKSKEVEKCDKFIDEFPAIALPANLDCEVGTTNDSSKSPPSMGPELA